MTNNLPLIGSAQAAKAFGVTQSTFNRWVSAGRIPVALTMDGDTGARLFDADVIEQLASQDRADAGAA